MKDTERWRCARWHKLVPNGPGIQGKPGRHVLGARAGRCVCVSGEKLASRGPRRPGEPLVEPRRRLKPFPFPGGFARLGSWVRAGWDGECLSESRVGMEAGEPVPPPFRAWSPPHPVTPLRCAGKGSCRRDGGGGDPREPRGDRLRGAEGCSVGFGGVLLDHPAFHSSGHLQGGGQYRSGVAESPIVSPGACKEGEGAGCPHRCTVLAHWAWP